LDSRRNKSADDITKKWVDKVTYDVVGAAIEVHKRMGRGLLESVYHECMKVELTRRNLDYFTELNIPVFYDEQKLAVRFRCDLFVENCLVVELKAVSRFVLEHEAKLLNHMRLLEAPKGILINFNCSNIFKEGQKTFVNDLYAQLK
jgi:GxxExxY protein